MLWLLVIIMIFECHTQLVWCQWMWNNYFHCWICTQIGWPSHWTIIGL